MLGKVNAELRQYTSVNKKAADQYGSFKEEVEELKKRRQEMDASESAGGLLTRAVVWQSWLVLWLLLKVASAWAQVLS